jgi:hypothetical protein
MDELKIEFASERRNFHPGEEVTGTVSWKLGSKPETVTLHLLWHTEGRADPEVELIRTVPFDNPPAEDRRPFSVYLPRGPYSFSGNLIALNWMFELVADSTKEIASERIVLSPTGEAIRPQEAEE